MRPVPLPERPCIGCKSRVVSCHTGSPRVLRCRRRGGAAQRVGAVRLLQQQQWWIQQQHGQQRACTTRPPAAAQIAAPVVCISSTPALTSASLHVWLNQHVQVRSHDLTIVCLRLLCPLVRMPPDPPPSYTSPLILALSAFDLWCVPGLCLSRNWRENTT